MARPRKHYFVDPKVQGALIVRVLLYWVLCLIGTTLILLVWLMATSPPRLFIAHLVDLWRNYHPALIASAAMLPLVLFDLVRFSNQFVGPLLRLRRAMRAAGRGEHVEPIHFRQNDFWQEVADEFNTLLPRMSPPTAEAETDHSRQEVSVVES